MEETLTAQMQDESEGSDSLEGSEEDQQCQNPGPYPISATNNADAALPAELQAFPVSAAQAEAPAAASATEASVASIMRNMSWVRCRTCLIGLTTLCCFV